MFIDVHSGPMPKRGDIVQSNVGKPRERTWMILRTHRVNRTIRKAGDLIPRFTVWMARWWELEPDFRMRLYRSAERNGGQNVLYFWRYPAKKRRETNVSEACAWREGLRARRRSRKPLFMRVF